MKFFFAFLVVAALLLAGGSFLGVVGFHYPRVIQNEPLKNPQKVVSVHGTDIVLERGAVISIHPVTGVDTTEASQISNLLNQTAFEIEVEDRGGPIAIYGRQNGWICGTPWAQPVRIPLIPDQVYKNRKRLIGLGSYVQSESQRNGPANGSQPIRSETNTTPGAVGSRR